MIERKLPVEDELAGWSRAMGAAGAWMSPVKTGGALSSTW